MDERRYIIYSQLSRNMGLNFDSFKKNPILIRGFDYNKVIGKVLDCDEEGNATIMLETNGKTYKTKVEYAYIDDGTVLAASLSGRDLIDMIIKDKKQT